MGKRILFNPKKKGRGKSIGNAFEREICYILSKWWSEGSDDDIFWRTDTSGGRATVRFAKGKKAQDFADIKAVKRCGEPLTNQILIECKKGYGTNLNPLNYFEANISNLLHIFWNKAEKEREMANKKWVWLIFRRNLKQITIMMEFSFFANMAYYHGSYKEDTIMVYHGDKVLVITKLKDFLNHIDPRTIVELESRPSLCKR